MKKKILVYLIVFSLGLFLFINVLNCSAEEVTATEIPTEEVEETYTPEIEDPNEEEKNDEPCTEEIEEEVTFSDQVQDFLDKWGTPIISAIAGVTGSSITVFLCKYVVSKLLEKIEEERKKSKENNDSANGKLAETESKLAKAQERLEKAEETLAKAQENFKNQSEQFKDIIASQKEILSEDQKFKELIAIMFATTPELMNNGISSKILELLNEKEVNSNE